MANWQRDKEGMGLWEHRGKVAVVGWGQSYIQRRWDGVDLERSCGGTSKESILKAANSMDYIEAQDAFKSKRKPKFQGK